jgi:hypothetical protein
MKTDTEIKSLGLKTLTDALGTVEAERFITLLLREPFDYTKWRQGLWEGQDVATISKAAMDMREAGDAS